MVHDPLIYEFSCYSAYDICTGTDCVNTQPITVHCYFTVIITGILYKRHIQTIAIHTVEHTLHTQFAAAQRWRIYWNLILIVNLGQPSLAYSNCHFALPPQKKAMGHFSTFWCNSLTCYDCWYALMPSKGSWISWDIDARGALIMCSHIRPHLSHRCQLNLPLYDCLLTVYYYPVTEKDYSERKCNIAKFKKCKISQYVDTCGTCTFTNKQTYNMHLLQDSICNHWIWQKFQLLTHSNLK